jgi:hypothetical protein
MRGGSGPHATPALSRGLLAGTRGEEGRLIAPSHAFNRITSRLVIRHVRRAATVRTVRERNAVAVRNMRGWNPSLPAQKMSAFRVRNEVGWFLLPRNGEKIF